MIVPKADRLLTSPGPFVMNADFLTMVTPSSRGRFHESQLN